VKKPDPKNLGKKTGTRKSKNDHASAVSKKWDILPWFKGQAQHMDLC
jgi:hypothetical protein